MKTDLDTNFFLKSVNSRPNVGYILTEYLVFRLWGTKMIARKSTVVEKIFVYYILLQSRAHKKIEVILPGLQKLICIHRLHSVHWINSPSAGLSSKKSILQNMHVAPSSISLIGICFIGSQFFETTFFGDPKSEIVDAKRKR